MKRFVSVILLMIILVSGTSAYSENIDLSGLSIEELASLRDRCQMEMMKSDQWQEVTVPVGVWEIGKDIPAGHWNLTASKESNFGWGSITYCDVLDESGKKASRKGKIYYYDQVKYPGSEASVEATNIDIDLKEGCYLVIEFAAMVFTPYTGKPDLGFK